MVKVEILQHFPPPPLHSFVVVEIVVEVVVEVEVVEIELEIEVVVEIVEIEFEIEVVVMLFEEVWGAGALQKLDCWNLEMFEIWR